jgi:lipopolysaccharide export system permease protein
VNDLARGRLAIKYMFFELLPVFLMGLTIFIAVLVMIQSFKLSEYVIVHGAQPNIMIRLVFYMILSYLPILLPIALLFAVLMVYGRMSGDSEIVAFKAIGLTPLHLITPVVIMGLAISFFSLQTTFKLAPWGNRQLDDLISYLAQTRPGVSIREGVFSEGLFDLVIYANKVDSRDGALKKVFIYDERNSNSPVTIIAREGQLINTNTPTGQEAFLRLINGDMHKSNEETYTKINFQSYDINLYDPHDIKERGVSPEALNISELRNTINDPTVKPKLKTTYILELHRRLALAAACVIFSIIGFSLATETNRRAARSGSMVICISIIVLYWTFSAGFESVSRAGYLPPIIGAWMTNLIAIAVGASLLRKVIKS